MGNPLGSPCMTKCCEEAIPNTFRTETQYFVFLDSFFLFRALRSKVAEEKEGGRPSRSGIREERPNPGPVPVSYSVPSRKTKTAPRPDKPDRCKGVCRTVPPELDTDFRPRPPALHRTPATERFVRRSGRPCALASNWAAPRSLKRTSQ